MLPNLTGTPAAEKFMRRIVRFSGLPSGAGFRLLVNSGGCSGYDAGFGAVTGAQQAAIAFMKDNPGPRVAASEGEPGIIRRVDVGAIGHGRRLLPPPAS